jgi:hypothetical protein
MIDEIKPADVDRFGVEHARGWNDNHSKEVFMLMDDIGVRPIIKRLVHYAYDCGYEHVSDGISFPIRCIAQLGFQDFNMKHPIGVMHDCLYREGKLSPWMLFDSRGDETAQRRWCDQRFGEGLWDCGNWFRANTWEWGLRMFGGFAWDHYRNLEAQGVWSHILNPAIIPPHAIKKNAT